MAEQLEAEDSASWERTGKDLVAGAAGGIAQVLLGQPFDIIKVRLQTTNQYSSALDCGKKILANEGPLAFYKGTLTPLIGIGACVSVQFGAFHYARRHLEEHNLGKHTNTTSTTSTKPSKPLTYTQYYLAGAFAGVTNSLLSGPIEHVRIRLQTQPHTARNHHHRLYNGPLDCIRKLTWRGGLFGGLYRGQAVTVLREAQAYGVWFLTFEYLMNLDIRRNNNNNNDNNSNNSDNSNFLHSEGRQPQQQQRQQGQSQPYSRSDISSVKVALYGGLAGEALWISSYPFDVVKSKMQSDGFGLASGSGSGSGAGVVDGRGGNDRAELGRQRYRNMRDCFAQTWRGERFRGFWRGIGPTLVRAMPVSAGTFAVVELVMRALD